MRLQRRTDVWQMHSFLVTWRLQLHSVGLTRLDRRSRRRRLDFAIQLRLTSAIHIRYTKTPPTFIQHTNTQLTHTHTLHRSKTKIKNNKLSICETSQARF